MQKPLPLNPTHVRRVIPKIIEWVKEKKPFALVRMSEGESRVLHVNVLRPESFGVAARKILKQTGICVSHADVLTIQKLIRDAFTEADILAITGSDSWNKEYRMWMDRLKDQYAILRTKPCITTHCFINRQIRDHLPIILKGHTKVSVISCRNLKPYLKETCGITDVVTYQVPSQYIMRNIDDEYEKCLHDVKMWPTAHHKIIKEIQVRERGEVFLIGAGLFGKDMCIRVRDLGGIALDLGSCLDSIVGKTTRGDGKPTPFSGPKPKDGKPKVEKPK